MHILMSPNFMFVHSLSNNVSVFHNCCLYVTKSSTKKGKSKNNHMLLAYILQL